MLIWPPHLNPKRLALGVLLALAVVFLASCASAPRKTIKTPTIETPTSFKTKSAITKAQTANDEARVYTSRMDAKSILVLKWLRERK